MTVLDFRIQGYETICWGCGLRLSLPSHSPIFRCGWCGAITNQNACRYENEGFSWRRLRGGLWAVYPVLFSVGYIFGIFNCTLTAFLALTTISTLSLASFQNAGSPPLKVWGSYPAVGKGDLDNYTFCHYCSKPKSPRSHHCRTCGMCILDMDHHCPFIGNCVGAANHRHFIYFLISAVISMIYVTIMAAYAGIHILPPVSHEVGDQLLQAGNNNLPTVAILKTIVLSLLSSSTLLTTRGLVLVYLLIAGFSVEIGLSVLLWQQLYFIYEGKTYLSSLSSHDGGEGEKDCRNFSRFFGWPYFTFRFLTSLRNPRKIHDR
ncbi:hypothetical protein V2J09_011528 [Rumex salicifolius]